MRRGRALGAIGLSTALLGVVGMCTGLAMSSQAEPGIAVNPFRPVSAIDANLDPSHHFQVLVEGDAHLYENESRGTVLVGDDLTWRGYRMAPQRQPYTVPGDETPAGLVVRGSIDFAGSTTAPQTMTVLSDVNAYFADLTNATVVRDGGLTHVVPSGGTAASLPAITVQRPQTAASMALDPGFDVSGLFSTYRQLSQEIAACPTTLQLLDQNGNGPWPGGQNATLRLVPGQNVLNINVRDLALLSGLNLAPGSAPLGAATLVFNVVDTGDYTWPLPSQGFQGDIVAAHVLWNLPTTGTVTLPVTEGDAVWGAVYAPSARLVDLSGSDIEGNVAVRELMQGTREGINGGDLSDVGFAGTVTPCGPPPTTTTTTEEPTTTSPYVIPTDTGNPLPTTDAPTTTVPITPGAPTDGNTPGGLPNGGGDALATTGLPAAVLTLGGTTATLGGVSLLLIARRRARRQ